MVAFLLHHLLGTPVGIVSASLSLAFSLSTGLTQKLLKTRNKKKKHNKIVMLATSRLNTVKWGDFGRFFVHLSS